MQVSSGWWGTAPRLLRAQADVAPDALIVADGDVSLTMGELRDKAAEFSRALIASGVESGDRVGVWAPNSWQWAVAAFGTWDAGGVLVPLSTRFKAFEAGELIERTGISVLIAAEGFLGASYMEMLADEFGPAAGDRPFSKLPDLRTTVVLAEEPVAGAIPIAEFLATGNVLDIAASEERALAVEPDDLIEILSTSGTTGKPKGVMLTHQQILRAYDDWGQIADLREGDRYPVVSPLAHGFGINAGLLACVMARAVMIPVALFDPDRALELIDDESISFMAGPPALFSRIINHEELLKHDVETLRVAIVGAADVPEDLIHQMRDVLGIERVVNAYGLIEGTFVTMTRAEDDLRTVATTTGRPVPGVSVRIVDENGVPVAVGERGEIHIHGYGVSPGYWQAPNQTAESIVGGWLHTGDIGQLDEAGNLSIVGRKKEMFIVGGFNTYPAEVESLLLRHEGIGQAAVVATPHPHLGEVGVAFVVAEPGRALEESEIIEWSRRSMSNYKVPRAVTVLDALPTTANGKIDKAALTESIRTTQ